MVDFKKKLDKLRATKHAEELLHPKELSVISTLEVYTAQFRYSGPDRLDTTVKTGVKTFAPTWEMVMGYKEGRITEDEYTNLYIPMMRASFKQNYQAWHDLLMRRRVVLVCYCKKGNFCHRHLLAHLLTKCGAKHCGEL